jgi:putative transposase
MQIQPLIEGQFFHIYNRGVNSENLFKTDMNYPYFIKKFTFYCRDVLDTYAYCLLKNHFHLVAFIKENVEVPKRNGDGKFRLNASTQLSHLFNSYAQSINKMYERTGPLFESPFERRLIDTNDYLRSAICYCHVNPELHRLVSDFKQWKYSSYHSIINNENELIPTQKVIELFGGLSQFNLAHSTRLNIHLKKYQVERNINRTLPILSSPAGLRAAVGINDLNESYRRL